VGGQSIAVTDMRDGLTPGSAIEVGLRPEDVQAGGVGASSLSMDVDFVEELGATQLFHGKVSGAEFVVQASTGQLPADTRKLTLAVDPANVHLFDPQTTKRLGRA
jgi:sn-glycerol 3-phosphate transport system ATP-binding protein